MKRPVPHPFALHFSRALAVLCTAAPLVAFGQQAIDLGTVGGTGNGSSAQAGNATPTASKLAPSQGSLDARSAVSTVSDEFVRNYTSPVADYSQVLQMTPGAFSYSPNGVGLGDTKTTLRGVSDSNTVISFDGIPFNDTNGVSHHSWVFFPSQFIGGAVIDRSPGSAATIGQATYAGSINLLSRKMEAEQRTSVTGSFGTWNTKLYGVEHETGQFGTDGAHNLLVNVQQMKSDGYYDYDRQKRTAFSAKYQYALNADTAITAFASYLTLANNTPNTSGVTRAAITAGNYKGLLSGDPTQPNYFGYNFYNISTDFNYLGVTSNLGNGWKLDDKLYTYRYWNKQNYNGTTAISSSSGVDKLNSYTTIGNLLRVSKDSSMGTFRTGLWIDQARSFRYQVPTDPRTWVDQLSPNFSEKYTTTTVQPYAEFEFKPLNNLSITPGIKYASYRQDFVHLQDNGGAVGTLGGVLNKTTGAITGGAASVSNGITYTDWMPSLDVRYKVQPNLTVYGQYAAGDQIPSTTVFDKPNAQVSVAPKPTRSKSLQFGTVWKSDAITLDMDIYRTTLEGAYAAVGPDAFGNFSYVPAGNQVIQGIEAESNIRLGGGFSMYVNGTVASNKYTTGQWVAGAPADTETMGLNYRNNGWDAGLFVKRVGKLYNDAKDGTHQAFTIDPVVVTNLFINYTIKNPTAFSKQARIQFGINNLFDRHSITGVASAVGSTPNPADLLTTLPGRALSLTATLDF